jgi:hypothetical protein
MLVLNPRLIASQPLNYDSLLPQSQTFSRDRTVRKEDVHDDAPDEAQSADDEKLKLPARQRALDVTDAETEKTA